MVVNWVILGSKKRMNRRRELARETKYRNKNKGGRKEERKDLAAAFVTRRPSAEGSQQKGRQLESMMMTTTTTTTTLQHTPSLCVYLVSYLPFLHVDFCMRWIFVSGDFWDFAAESSTIAVLAFLFTFL